MAIYTPNPCINIICLLRKQEQTDKRLFILQGNKITVRIHKRFLKNVFLHYTCLKDF